MNSFEKYLPNILHQEEESLESKKSKDRKEVNPRTQESVLAKAKALGRKGVFPFLAGLSMFGAAKSSEGQTRQGEKDITEKVFTLKLPNEQIRKFSSEAERRAFTQEAKMILYEEDGTIVYPDGRVVKNEKEIKKDTTKLEPVGKLTYYWPNFTGTDARPFSSIGELMNTVKNVYHANYDPSRVFVKDENGKSFKLLELKNDYKKDTLPSRPARPNEKGVRLTGKLTYYWPNFTGTDARPFSSIEELIHTVKNVYHANYDPNRVMVKDEAGHQAKLSEVEGSSGESGQESIHPKLNPNVSPNQPLESEEGLDITKFKNKIPKGKGKVIQLNNDGSASIYKVTKKGRKTKIKEKAKMGVITPENNQEGQINY